MMKGFSHRLTAVCSAAAIACGALCSMPVWAVTEPLVRIEGEDLEGAEVWTSIYENQIPGYSGEGFAYLTNGALSFTVDAPADGMYSIVVHGAQILEREGRQQTMTVNGSEYSIIAPYLDTWSDIDFGMVRLNKGENEIAFINKYGYMAIDYVTVSEAEFPDLSQATATTCDPDATPETKALMTYLQSVYGNQIIAGQQEIYGGGHSVSPGIRYDAGKDACVDNAGTIYEIDKDSKDTDEQGNTFYWHCTGPDGKVYTYNTQNRDYGYNDYDQECEYLYDLTGHYPAIRGFDFNTHSPGFAWEDGVTDRMISWAKDRNGICTASWHVTVPKQMADFEVDKNGNITKISDDWQAFTYDTNTDFKTANVLVEGTKEYVFFREAMRLLAAEIQKLQDANVPLIFRPLHEAEGNPGKNADGSGAWFWWSKEGAAVYHEVWKLLYTTLTEEYGLHNMIWEQNLYTWSDESALWYTGDEWVDIVAYDKYNTEYHRHDGNAPNSGPNFDAETGIFYKLVGYTDGNKMVAMAENDSVPSLNNMQVEHAYWLYFCPWYDGEAGAPQFISGEQYQDKDELIALYNSDFCITLDELPEDLYTRVPGTTKPPETTDGSDKTKSVRGDADCSGLLDVSDAVLLARYLAEDKGAFITDQGKLNADMNESGAPDQEDVILMLRTIAELI